MLCYSILCGERVCNEPVQGIAIFELKSYYIQHITIAWNKQQIHNQRWMQPKADILPPDLLEAQDEVEIKMIII